MGKANTPGLYGFSWRKRGHVPVHKFGRNVDLDAADNEILVHADGSAYAFQTTAQTLEVVSASTTDDAATGQGAWTVTVFGLDANWELQEDTATMDGTTPVALAGTWIRVYRARVVTAGTDGDAGGIITIRVAGAGATQCTIPAGLNSSEIALYTIPEGYDGYLLGWDAAVDSQAGNEIIMRLKTKDNNIANGVIKAEQTRLVNRDDSYTHTFAYPLHVGPRTDVMVTSEVGGAATDVDVTAQFEIVLIPNASA